MKKDLLVLGAGVLLNLFLLQIFGLPACEQPPWWGK